MDNEVKSYDLSISERILITKLIDSALIHDRLPAMDFYDAWSLFVKLNISISGSSYDKIKRVK